MTRIEVPVLDAATPREYLTVLKKPTPTCLITSTVRGRLEHFQEASISRNDDVLAEQLLRPTEAEQDDAADVEEEEIGDRVGVVTNDAFVFQSLVQERARKQRSRCLHKSASVHEFSRLKLASSQ